METGNNQDQTYQKPFSTEMISVPKHLLFVFVVVELAALIAVGYVGYTLAPEKAVEVERVVTKEVNVVADTESGDSLAAQVVIDMGAYRIRYDQNVLELINDRSEVVQTIEVNFSQFTNLTNQDALVIVNRDINYDHYLDVGILKDVGNGGVNRSYEFYVWNQQEGRLEKMTDFEGPGPAVWYLSNPSFNIAEQTVTSASKSAQQWNYTEYAFTDGVYAETRSWSESWDEAASATFSFSPNINGHDRIYDITVTPEYVDVDGLGKIEWDEGITITQQMLERPEELVLTLVRGDRTKNYFDIGLLEEVASDPADVVYRFYPYDGKGDVWSTNDSYLLTKKEFDTFHHVDFTGTYQKMTKLPGSDFESQCNVLVVEGPHNERVRKAVFKKDFNTETDTLYLNLPWSEIPVDQQKRIQAATSTPITLTLEQYFPRVPTHVGACYSGFHFLGIDHVYTEVDDEWVRSTNATLGISFNHPPSWSCTARNYTVNGQPSSYIQCKEGDVSVFSIHRADFPDGYKDSFGPVVTSKSFDSFDRVVRTRTDSGLGPNGVILYTLTSPEIDLTASVSFDTRNGWNHKYYDSQEEVFAVVDRVVDSVEIFE